MHALFDRWNQEESYLASYSNYRITCQELSLLCGERYPSDEILNLLVESYVTTEMNKAKWNKTLFFFLFFQGVIFKERCGTHMLIERHGMCRQHVLAHIHEHVSQTVLFDDGYHCSILESLKSNAKKILDIIYKTTDSDKYKPSNWNAFKWFTVSMYWDHWFGSCGVLASVVGDICNNRNTAFSWNYNDSPSLRAKLMLQILDILH